MRLRCRGRSVPHNILKMYEHFENGSKFRNTRQMRVISVSNAHHICPIFSARNLQMTRARQLSMHVIQPGPTGIIGPAWDVLQFYYQRRPSAF